MSRLIDADKLIEDLTYTIETMIEENEDDDFGEHNEYDIKYLEGNINFSEIVKKLIEKQPTVFDVDKVVEQLEIEKYRLHCLKNDCIALSDKEVYAIENKVYNKAIEIVKAGGRDES